MDSKALINCADIIDESICTVIILRYKVYRNDSGKIFGKLLVLKHKVENFLKEVFDEEMLFQNPTLQRTKQGLLELTQGLTYLCSGITPTGEVLNIPELPLQDIASEESSFEMKFVKGTSLSDLWLCYVDDGEFSSLLQRLREKYDKDELQPFIFYPRIGEHVYFRQGANIFRGIVLEYVIPDDGKDDDKEEVDVDIKVLNVDNSDVVVLPQNCFFQLDKEGTELPMQCTLCALEAVDNSSANNVVSSSDLSFSSLQKHKLNVVFHGKKVVVENSSIEAQSVNISICTDENGAYVTRNSLNVFFPSYTETNSDQLLSYNSCQTPANQEDVSESDSDVSLLKQDVHSLKHDVSNDSTFEKCKTENFCDKSSHKSNDLDDVVSSMSDLSVDSDIKAPENKDVRDKSLNSKDIKLTKFDKTKPPNKPAPERKDSSLSNDLPPPVRMKLIPNVSLPSSNPPYHYSPGPPFHSAPMHFSTPYMPFPAAQHITPPTPFHFPQYPYGPYIPQTAPPLPPQPPGAHSQAYYMPPSSSAYQSYVQPVAPIMASYYPSQPHYPPQFYHAPPSQLPPSWSQMQPSYRVSSPSPVSVVSVAVNKDAMNATVPNINKPK